MEWNVLGAELDVGPLFHDGVGKRAHLQTLETRLQSVHGDGLAVAQLEAEVGGSRVLHGESPVAIEMVSIVEHEAVNVYLGSDVGSVPGLNDTSALLGYWSENIRMDRLSIVPGEWLRGRRQDSAQALRVQFAVYFAK